MTVPDRTEIASPCVKLCTLDPTGAYCLGCGRSVAEIAGWTRLDEADRRAVIDRLASVPAPEIRTA
jgi:predicted Fe-S protein YdhL (DUF1289 family)